MAGVRRRYDHSDWDWSLLAGWAAIGGTGLEAGLLKISAAVLSL